MYEVGKGRVGLHDHRGVEWDGEFGGEFGDALGLMLTAAVGEEDEWDVVLLEVGEGFRGAGNGCGGAEEDAIDTAVRLSDICLDCVGTSYSKAKAKSGTVFLPVLYSLITFPAHRIEVA